MSDYIYIRKAPKFLVVCKSRSNHVTAHVAFNTYKEAKADVKARRAKYEKEAKPIPEF